MWRMEEDYTHETASVIATTIRVSSNSNSTRCETNTSVTTLVSY